MTTVPTPRRSGACGDWTGERGHPLLIRTGPLRPRLSRWGRTLLQTMSSCRYALGACGHPAELRFREPQQESL